VAKGANKIIIRGSKNIHVGQKAPTKLGKDLQRAEMAKKNNKIRKYLKRSYGYLKSSE
jgi:hypothetical protein